MRILLLAALAAVAIGPVHRLEAQSTKILVNVKDGLALDGYDPVSYFTGAPAKGSAAYTATHQGATYRFASAENRAKFVADPAKYAPQFGGYCGYAASEGRLASVDPLAYTIMNDRLVLQNSKRVLQLWQKEPEARLKKADANWPTLLEREGKTAP